MTIFDLHKLRMGFPARLGAALLALGGLGVAQALDTDAQYPVPTAGEFGNGEDCRPFSGCNNVDLWQTLFLRDRMFSGSPSFDVTGFVFRVNEGGSYGSMTFSDVEIRLKTVAANSLSGGFFSGGDTVYRGPLMLTEVDGEIAISLDPCPPTATCSTFNYDPRDGNLGFSWLNWGGEGEGRSDMLIDFEDAGGAVITAYYQPRQRNRPLGSTVLEAQAAGASHTSTSGPVATILGTLSEDPSNLSDIYVAPGNGFVLNTPNVKKTAQIASGSVGNSLDFQACLFWDDRWERGLEQVQPWSTLVPVAGACAWAATSPLRFPKHIQAALGKYVGNNVGDPRDDAFVNRVGSYVAITHAVTDNLALESVVVTDQTTLLQAFGVIYVDEAGNEIDPPQCNADNIFDRPIAAVGEHVSPPNTDTLIGDWQCNRLLPGTRGTDIAEMLWRETSNDENYQIRQMINHIRALNNAVGSYVDPVDLTHISIIQQRLEQISNAFVSGTTDGYKRAYRGFENIAWHAQEIDCSSCPPEANGNALTAPAVAAAKALWDRYYWPSFGGGVTPPGADLYVCYRPRKRTDLGFTNLNVDDFSTNPNFVIYFDEELSALSDCSFDPAWQ